MIEIEGVRTRRPGDPQSRLARLENPGKPADSDDLRWEKKES